MTTEGTTPALSSAEEVQPAAIAAPEESLPLPAAPPVPDPAPVGPPPPVQPVADRGTSDGTQVCTVCLRLIGAGETYVKTAVRGINHLDPCSHRS